MSSELAYYLANLAKDRGRPEEAIRLLRDALNTEQPFAYRKAAKELLARLAKASGAASGATKSGQQAR